MSKHKQPPDPSEKLVNRLTISDAQHLLRNEGGERSLPDLVGQLLSTALVAALTARAIRVGDATVWHLTLPMVAQWLALITIIPLIYAVVRHPAMRKDAVGSMRLWAGMVVFVAIATASRSREHGIAWQEQLAGDAMTCWKWITDAEMHWPMLLAFLGMSLEIPGRVRNLYKFGPPFVGAGLGCAMRLLVVFLGVFLLPWAMASQTRMAWTLWGMILAAELLALSMHWDIQRRLRKAGAAG